MQIHTTMRPIGPIRTQASSVSPSQVQDSPPTPPTKEQQWDEYFRRTQEFDESANLRLGALTLGIALAGGTLAYLSRGSSGVVDHLAGAVIGTTGGAVAGAIGGLYLGDGRNGWGKLDAAMKAAIGLAGVGSIAGGIAGMTQMGVLGIAGAALTGAAIGGISHQVIQDHVHNSISKEVFKDN